MDESEESKPLYLTCQKLSSLLEAQRSAAKLGETFVDITTASLGNFFLAGLIPAPGIPCIALENLTKLNLSAAPKLGRLKNLRMSVEVAQSDIV